MSSKAKDLMKKGWHPEKPGTKLRGQVSGLIHRNKSDEGSTHVARPISELRDPASFAPPPKRTGTGLAPAPPPSEPGTRKVVPAPSKYQDPRAPQTSPPPRAQEQQYEEVEEQQAPRGPYRVNTSGLSTDHLPKPPGRRDGADGRSPPPPSYETATIHPTAPPKPSLPPRLPPRTNTSSTSSPTSASSDNLLNQGAVNRLGSAGVSVPGLGIGGQKTTSSPPPPPPSRQPAAQVNELQNRFSRMNTGSSGAQEQPAEGTTWAQKQAALKTASSFQKDPSSVSFSDAKAAAGTANNFRQRHGEQVAAGVKSANGLNQKYGVTSKIGGFGGGGQQQQEEPAQTLGPASAASSIAGKKKPPPPPPKKKPGIGGSAPAAPPPAADEPPPIPMATRPTF